MIKYKKFIKLFVLVCVFAGCYISNSFAKKNYKLLEKQQQNMKMRFSSTTEINSPQAMSMMVQLTSIRLLPEYELYHSLFGKPKKETKETYEQNKINTIKKLLERENMDYQQMKNYFEEKDKSI
jgi:hypothetical protein